jgi:hypothetical protein
MYQLSSANFTKKTVTVPRVVFAHCKPTSRCHGPFANLLIHSIHDPSVLQSPQSELESPSDGSAGSPLSSSEPRSKFDEEHDRNVYPITWRVIGGGVMMGGQSTYITRVITMPTDWREGEICTRYKDGACPDSDDCPYTHPWEGTLGHIQVPSYAH